MILQNLLVCELTFTLYLSTAIAICKTEARRMKTDLGSVAPLLLLVAVIPAGKPIYSKQKRESLKMKRDVGMVYQKVHKQGRTKVMVIQSLVHPYIFRKRAKM